MRALVAVIALVGCGGPRTAATETPALAASGPRLPSPLPVDPAVRGASYLTAVAQQIQPAWANFLEDCRLRLPITHALNDPSLEAIADLAITMDGRIADVRISRPSGNGEFDTAVFDVLGDASPLPHAAVDLASDDERVHVRWLFARDRRQAGPATAKVIEVRLPLLGVIDHLLAERQLARAATRVSRAPASDPERGAAAERVMVAVLREGLASPYGNVREETVEAIGTARVRSLAEAVHRLVSPTIETDLRLAAITASARLGDRGVVPSLLEGLRADLESRPSIALAKIGALVALGRATEVGAIIGAQLERPSGIQVTALAALALAPDPALAPKLETWFRRGGATIREAVCTALPAAAPATATEVIARGLRDPDASVRATCVDAAARQGRAAADAATLRRLRVLVRDRDRMVRARALAALARLDPKHRQARAFEDPVAAVRLAAIGGATDSELRALAADPDADVRAAAIRILGDRAPELVVRAIRDPAAQVRKAAIPALTDDEMLSRLANDDAPEVATAAEIRYAARRGRAAVTTAFLDRIAGAPASGLERVRIALAWLLAR